MGKRKRIVRIQVGELNALIEQQKNKFERSKSMYAEIVQDIMKENDCSWTEAKQIHKFRKVSKGIKREIDLLTCSHS
jgi:hypothetical protein